ncbi:hypothetical protein N7517_001179 [Penicillium concentricum]|uniref:Uncharacterized protein n=1 Tax=Penicillium concentricum TaxID=293559 RepID=A0A9W9SRD1_9EURO|nr:uncharacterized protein N7517_001179 [Penicillium concentricum]KAJ5383268.1 hypothetical protein N7517_001179 [Penicillium concentricum]
MGLLPIVRLLKSTYLTPPVPLTSELGREFLILSLHSPGAVGELMWTDRLCVVPGQATLAYSCRVPLFC